MEEVTDISYYIGQDGVEALKNLDVPVEGGDVVSLSLTNAEEIPPDPEELVMFFDENKSGKHFWIIVASAYAQLGKLEEAIQIIKSALKSANFNEEEKKTFQSYLVWLYFRYVALGIDKETNLTQAGAEISKLRAKIQKDPQTSPINSTSNLLAEAVLSLYQGADDSALDIFERILRTDQNNSFALMGKAQAILSKTKNYSHALKLYQQVLILNPAMKPDPRVGIGLCFWFLKDNKMAIQAFERALELDANNTKAKIFLTLANFYTTFNSSLSDEEFLSNYKKCLVEVSKLHKQNVQDATILLVIVSYYCSKEDYDTVEKIIKGIVSQITGSDNLTKFSHFNKTSVSRYQLNVLSECSTWLARVEFAKGDFTQASKYFQEAIKMNESNIVAKLGLGQSQYNRGLIEEASLTFESILRSNVNCLEVNYSLGILYSKQNSRRKRDLAVQVLERYIRLSNNRGLSAPKNDSGILFNKEPIALNAYLTLSKLYEDSDINQSLNYLSKAVELAKQGGKSIPMEIYNNIGVFQFTKQNFQKATENFQLALEQLDSNPEFTSSDGDGDGGSDLLVDLPKDLKVTLTFNLARSKEVSNKEEALQAYESLLTQCPHYFSAKLRILFLSCIISESKLSTEEIKNEIEELLNLNASDLEIRSFYGWFIKNFGKKLGMKPDADTKFQKQTLVDYDKHDCYALISLANIYCVMARDIKGPNMEEKKRNYYIRAIELYTKVLTVDPKNVYAAQGLAIAYIENKESIKGLDILRKIRDSLNDISVYLNLGHVLCELKQFGKAIENYELALGRYTDGKDVKILTFLGRAWYLRAANDQSLIFFKRGLEYAKQALELTKGSKSALLFNVAYIQFQIADFVSKQSLQQRKPQDISDAIDGLQEAINTLIQLASDEEKHPPYPKDELRGRANLGSSTLLNRLTNAFDETKENIASVEQKLQTAKQLREQEKEARVQEEQAKLDLLKEKEAALAKERAVLEEQAKQWAEEAAKSNVLVQDGDDDDDGDDGYGDGNRSFGEDSEVNNKSSRGSRGKRTDSKKSKRATAKSKRIVDDDDDDDDDVEDEDDVVNDDNDVSEDEHEAEFSGGDNDDEQGKVKSNGKKRKRVVNEGNGDDENVDPEVKAANGSKKQKRKKYLSEEFIKDSDEELDDDDGGVEEEENNKIVS
ncbi:CTR9 [Candida oxycetoniae]|uniref:CTR9 n=1 Tax=Candida oxycetoniae TaxID=497107 RepID=A0AAI9WY90_9ASCO|nr:CTR9 [Candida oxycetoniae]KAI3405122.2 CTR9 [Candida oxycetoniae]